MSMIHGFKEEYHFKEMNKTGLKVYLPLWGVQEDL